MHLRLFKFIVFLMGAVILFGCSAGVTPSTPTSLPATSTSAPIIPTIPPTTTAVPLPTIAFLPTISMATADPSISALPTFSFSTPATAVPPIPIQTISGESPFEFVATLDKILPSTDGYGYFRKASDGSMLLITNGGIARISDSGWKVYLSDYASYFVGMDTLGRAWFINQTIHARPPWEGPSHSLDSISAWDGTQWTNYSSESGWTSFSIDPPNGFTLAESHGLIWVSTIRDVRVFDGARWKVVNTQQIGLDPSPALFVQSFASAKEVWVTGCYFDTSPSHGSDIYWYDESGWHSQSMPEDSGCISTMHEDRQGNVWLVVDNTLWRFTRATQEWTHYAVPGTPSSRITSLDFNESGEPWFISLTCDTQRGCTESTLYHLQNDIWIRINSLNSGSRLFSVWVDSANQVWVSGTDGIYQIVNNQPRLVSYLRVSSWAMDKAGKIWVIGNDPSANNRPSLWVTNP